MLKPWILWWTFIAISLLFPILIPQISLQFYLKSLKDLVFFGWEWTMDIFNWTVRLTGNSTQGLFAQVRRRLPRRSTAIFVWSDSQCSRGNWITFSIIETKQRSVRVNFREKVSWKLLKSQSRNKMEYIIFLLLLLLLNKPWKELNNRRLFVLSYCLIYSLNFYSFNFYPVKKAPDLSVSFPLFN